MENFSNAEYPLLTASAQRNLEGVLEVLSGSDFKIPEKFHEEKDKKEHQAFRYINMEWAHDAFLVCLGNSFRPGAEAVLAYAMALSSSPSCPDIKRMFSAVRSEDAVREDRVEKTPLETQWFLQTLCHNGKASEAANLIRSLLASDIDIIHMLVTDPVFQEHGVCRLNPSMTRIFHPRPTQEFVSDAEKKRRQDLLELVWTNLKETIQPVELLALMEGINRMIRFNPQSKHEEHVEFWLDLLSHKDLSWWEEVLKVSDQMMADNPHRKEAFENLTRWSSHLEKVHLMSRLDTAPSPPSLRKL